MAFPYLTVPLISGEPVGDAVGDAKNKLVDCSTLRDCPSPAAIARVPTKDSKSNPIKHETAKHWVDNISKDLVLAEIITVKLKKASITKLRRITVIRRR
jgi:hypothetical protein